MRLKIKISIFVLLCFSAVEIYASHISGAEITYKYLFGTTYKFTLKVYRDCNECKFNGIGGGNNSSTCNEVPNLVIRGAVGSNGANTVLGNIEISRKNIQDVTLSCISSVSKCRPGSNLNLGYEMHVFEGDFDFANLLNGGYCKLDVSINMSSRSVNINPQQSEQNFFNYAMINLCESIPNESVEFTASPQFVHYLNQSNFSALNLINKDNDSLAFSLKPALVNRNVSINYANGRSSDIPLTYFCQSAGTPPCPVNFLGPLVSGFYCSKTNGDIAFTPILANQGGVMVIECEEWKRNANGNYYLAGIVRRDIYSEVINSNNNLPNIKTKLGNYTICEGERFSTEINVEDLPFGLSSNDTVFAELFTSMPGATLEKLPVNYAPYFKYIFRVEPSLNQTGTYNVTLNMRDNHCPLVGQIAKSFSFTVLKKRELNVVSETKNCGLFTAIIQNYPGKNFTWTLRDAQTNTIKQMMSRKFNALFTSGGTYFLEIIMPAEKGFCEVKIIDTIVVGDLTIPVLNMGSDYSVCKNTLLEINPISFENYDEYELSIDGVVFSSFPYHTVVSGVKNLSFKVTQKNGCTYEDKITISQFEALAYKKMNDTVCSNAIFPKTLSNIIVDRTKIQKIDYSFNSASSILIKQNSIDWNFDFVNNSNPIAHAMTVYSVVTDKNLCTYFDTSFVKVVEPNPILVNAPEQLCVNAPLFNLETRKGGSWECVNFPVLVKNNKLSLTGAQFNQLVLKYTESDFCTNSKTYFINLLDTSIITFAHPSQLSFCENNSLFELKGIPAGGQWTGDGVQNGYFNPSAFAGRKYKILYEVSNQNQCVSKSNIGVEIEKLPALKVLASKSSICIGDVLSLQALSSVPGNGYWYSDGLGRFDDASSQITNYQPNANDVLKQYIKFVYTIQTNGICGNVNSEVTAKIKNGPSGDILNDYVKIICEPAKFEFKSSYTQLEKQYWFVNDSLVEEFDYNFNFNVVLKAGEYVIKTRVSDSACEALSISQNITVLPTPKIELLSNPVSRVSREYPRLFLKDKTTCSNGHTVNWFYNQTWIGNSREFYYTVDGIKDSFTIKLVAESGKGSCKDSATQLYVFIPINQLYIPDAFSPDAKGPDENNKFRVHGPAMREFEIEIFNKYGEKVFVSNNMNEAWDGSYKNVDCMLGVYFYKIITTDYEGISRDYSGTITLVR